jgi:hypothetical protein
MWTSWNGLTGRNPSAIPDPPEPPSDRWLDDHCPRCKYNHEWEENGVWYGECTAPYGCDFEEREDDED